VYTKRNPFAFKETEMARHFRGLLFLAIVTPLGAKDPNISRLPSVSSLFPMGGMAGSRFYAEVRGTGLERAFGVWSDAPGIEAKITSVEGTPIVQDGQMGLDEKKALRGQIIQVDMEIGRAVPPGVYSLRILSHDGISNPIPFLVSSEPVIIEAQNPHDTPKQAPELRWPVIVNGRLDRPGAFNLYTFQVREGEKLGFEVFSRPIGDAPANKLVQSGFDAQLFLYKTGGSWFDPDRLESLAYNDDPTFDSIDANPQLAYKFNKPGKYLVEVRAYPGESPVPPGGPDDCYQLLIRPAGRRSLSDSAREKWESLLARSRWREQTFERRLDAHRMQELAGRSQPALANSKVTVTVIEDVIAQPGESHNHKFKVNAGERLAFELETPGAAPPEFNPLMTVLDAEGHELFTNVYLRIGRNPNYRKTVQPKVLYQFQAGGEFTAQVRDITSRRGGPACRYRLLIRPQVPHMGEIEVTDHFVNPDGRQADYPIDRINLVAGTAKKLSVRTSLEEGFAGSVITTIEGLPPGVELLPASETEPDDTPPLDQGDKRRFLPKTSTTTLVLLARRDTPITTVPHFVRTVVTPVYPDGSLGMPLSVQPIPLMVTRANPEDSPRTVAQTGR
jgi:hypothetical protein